MKRNIESVTRVRRGAGTPGPYMALILAAALPCFGQIASRTQPVSTPSVAPAAAAAAGQPVAGRVAVPLRMFYGVERACDDKLRSIGDPNTMDVLGATRGVYLDGYGAVFTAEITLATGPALYAFHQTITPQEKTGVHQKMVTRLPLLRDVVKDMVRNIAASLATIPENQQIVVAVRLDYTSWEDSSGLPGLMMAKADRKSALAGVVQVEEQ